MRGHVAGLALALGLAVGCDNGLALPPEDLSEIRVHNKPGIGEYIADRNGRALYSFSGDDDGNSACLTNCATVWRPAMTEKVPRVRGPAIRADRLGIAMRPDSTSQLMYNRILLYYYEPDVQPGETYGHNAMSFGGRFSLVTVGGRPFPAPR